MGKGCFPYSILFRKFAPQDTISRDEAHEVFGIYSYGRVGLAIGGATDAGGGLRSL